MSAPGGMFDSVRRGVMWSAGTFFAGRGLTFISTLILARVLTPDDFGVVAAIIVFLGFIELGSDVGMNATIVYEQESGVTPRVQTAFTINLLAATVLTALGVAVAPLVAALFNMEAHTNLFRLSALSLLGIGLGKRPRRPAHARAVTSAAVRSRGSCARSSAASSRSCSPWWVLGAGALVAGMLAGTAVWTVALWLLVPLRPTFRLDRGIARSMVGYAPAPRCWRSSPWAASRTGRDRRRPRARGASARPVLDGVPAAGAPDRQHLLEHLVRRLPALARKRANDDMPALGERDADPLRFSACSRCRSLRGSPCSPRRPS
jgi:hypothetical protein